MDQLLGTHGWDRGPGAAQIELVSAINEPRTGRRECPIYPTVVPRRKRTTMWLMARDGFFIDLEQAR